MNRVGTYGLVILCSLIFVFGEASEYKEKTPKKDFVVTIHTSYGDMVFILFDETPKHKENFLKLTREGYYDSTTFHRIINEFMIQGGDANSKDDNPNNDGSGNIGYTIEAEFNKSFIHQKGALAAARNNNPEKRSSGSQFYIVQGKKQSLPELDQLITSRSKKDMTLACRKFMTEHQDHNLTTMVGELYSKKDYRGIDKLVLDSKDLLENTYGAFTDYTYTELQKKIYEELGGTPFLDQDYTVFGIIIKGIELIDEISAQEKNSRDRPLKDIRMTVTAEELKRKKITKIYGYQYPGIKK